MKWTTRAQLHLDRTASAWLIRRFVDSDAQFEFLDWDRTPDASDVRAFGMPGIPLSNHDEDGTSFEKILRAHRLTDDEALVRLGRCVGSGVRHALALTRVEEDDQVYATGLALDALGTGLGLTHPNDHEHLDAATPLYDALHTYFRLPDLSRLELPNSQPARHEFLQSLVK